MKKKTSEMLHQKYENSQLEYDNYLDFNKDTVYEQHQYTDETYNENQVQNDYNWTNNNQIYYTTGEYFPKKIKIHRWEESYLYDDSMDFENSEYFNLLNEYQNQQEQSQNVPEQVIENNNRTFTRR